MVGGGINNSAAANRSTVAGGSADSSKSAYCGVLAGEGNIAGSLAKDSCATVAGGQFNRACSTWSYIGGGGHNTAGGASATVGGGLNNVAGIGYATVGGGLYNQASFAPYATVAGGDSNLADDRGTTVSGGAHNQAYYPFGTVGGGLDDTAKSICSGVLSGYGNVAGYFETDSCAVVAGGLGNNASARYSAVGGGQSNTASSEFATVSGGNDNTASGINAIVGGGSENTASDTFSIVVGGLSSLASGTAATVGGGGDNTASGYCATVSGGLSNKAPNYCATVGGGDGNAAPDTWATVGGGASNAASGTASTISGGGDNAASGYCATVPGGLLDTAGGWYSFATGCKSIVSSSYSNSAAFNGQTATASGQTRVGILSKASGTFTIDDPLDPEHKILNHYFVESPDMSNLYSGSVTLDGSGRAEVDLPDYFDALNRNPRIQLTGVGSSDVYVAQDIAGNHFAVGGKPGTKVYWQVTGDRKDQSAEITRDLMPVEQPKTGALAGRSLDDDLLISTLAQLEAMGLGTKYQFHTAAARQRYEDRLKQMSEAEQHKSATSVQPRVQQKQPEPRAPLQKPQP
jgi:hypothetical protein